MLPAIAAVGWTLVLYLLADRWRLRVRVRVLFAMLVTETGFSRQRVMELLNKELERDIDRRFS